LLDPVTNDVLAAMGEQVAFADVVLVNKIDLVSSADLASIEKRIRQINPYAQTYSTERCGIDLGKVLGRDAFNLDRILEIEPAFLGENHDHEHDDQIGSLSLRLDQPVKPEIFIPWIEGVVQQFGADILRMKGIISLQDVDKRFVIQGVHMLIEGAVQRPWRSDEKRESRLVFIGRDLPRDLLVQGFEAGLSIPHDQTEHDPARAQLEHFVLEDAQGRQRSVRGDAASSQR
jgi:G3E family GTPase